MIWRKTTPGEGKARALVDPSLDFWLVGGAGVLMLAVFALISQQWPSFDLVGQAAIWAAYAAFAVNFPHFAYSYLLFYPGFLQRLTGTETTLISRIRLAIAGILVPLVMLAYFGYAWKTQDARLLSFGVMAMIFTVGWHYVKQGYGVLITLSLYRSVFYAEWEKRILYVNGYMVWIYTWCRTNSVTGVQPYYDITYSVTAYPAWVVTGALVLSWVTTAAAAGVLLKHWLYDKKGVSWSGVMGYVAGIYLWVMLPYMNMAFYVFIPLFHSLQYFPFVYKFKLSEFNRARHAPEGDAKRTHRRAILWLMLFTAAGFALGALFFDTVPKYIDAHPWVTSGNPVDFVDLDPQFFLITFIVFINIHHFFIDSAFWRRDNAKVQQYLFRA